MTLLAWDTDDRTAQQWVGAFLRLALTVVAAAIIALIVKRLPGSAAPWSLLAAPAAIAVFAAAVRWGPRWCLAVLVVSTCLGLYQASASAGRVNLRLTDVPYVALVWWVLVVRTNRGPRRADMGQRWLAVFLGLCGVSLLPLLVSAPHDLLGALVSWARLVQTFSLVWLVPYAVDRPADRRFLMGTVAAGCTLELAWAIFQVWVHGHLGEAGVRLRAGNGPDTEGLLAVILIVTVLYGRIPRARSVRVLLVALGLAALLLSRSVGATVAGAIVLGLAPLPRRSGEQKIGYIRPASLMILAFLALGVVAWLRPNTLPTSKLFDHSSTAARVVVAADGVEIFRHHPVLGVGFERSQEAGIIDDPGYVAQLHRWFPKAPDYFFPNASVCQAVPSTSYKPPQACDIGSVHNAYIQVAAEEGAIGLIALIIVAFAIRRRVRALRWSAIRTTTLSTMRWAWLTLAVILIWWNDNPLFGAQPETVLAALLLGVFAVPWEALSADEPVARRRRPMVPV